MDLPRLNGRDWSPKRPDNQSVLLSARAAIWRSVRKAEVGGIRARRPSDQGNRVVSPDGRVAQGEADQRAQGWAEVVDRCTELIDEYLEQVAEVLC